jgi:hypothetical protein
MELYIWFSITLSANILIFTFSCFLKQLPPFPCRFNFCIAPLLQEVQAPGLKFIWKKQFSMFFSLLRLYLTLSTIKTSEFSTLGRSIYSARPGAWTSCNKGVMQKLKRHGNGGSCFKKHEKVKIKIFVRFR